MNSSVVILGGGIGGCSTAHALRKGGYTGKITIVERGDRLGGEARSEEWNGLPTEHCWRIYGSGYSTLYKIMKEIPVYSDPNETSHEDSTRVNAEQQTVFDNLRVMNPYLVAPNEDEPFFFSDASLSDAWKFTSNARKSMTMREKLAMTNKLLRLSTSSLARLKGEFSKIAWKDYLAPPTPEALDYLVRVVGPFYGVDLYKASVSAVWEVLENTNGPASEPGLAPRTKDFPDGPPTRVMGAPTNDAWFRHWHKLLANELNVEIQFGTTVESIVMRGDDVQNIIVSKGIYSETISADWYILALPLSVVNSLVDDARIRLLTKKAEQYMIGLQIYFSEQIILPSSEKNIGILLPESPWQLIIEPQGNIWQLPDNDIWSVGICDPETPGSVYKRPFRDCTREQVEHEVWHQIIHSSFARDTRGATTGTALGNIRPVSVRLFDSYQWDSRTQRLETREVKTSPNAGTWELRPETVYKKNALFATSFTRNSREMVLMDAAAEAGVNAAMVILKAHGIHTKMYPFENRKRKWNIALWPLRKIDEWLHRAGKPHLASYFGGQAWIPIVIQYILVVGIIAGAVAGIAYTIDKLFLA